MPAALQIGLQSLIAPQAFVAHLGNDSLKLW
jgi:hypothetical protein